MPSTASPTRRRRAVFTAVAAAVLLLIGVPAAASAKTTCDTGEFCLYSNPNLSGGLYQFSGSDSNLWNDDFENEDTVLIAGTNAQSAQNRCTENPSDLIDVADYTRPALGGRSACIRRGAGGNLRRGFARNLGSYEWVTRAECSRLQSALAARSPAG
jgi:hypothetical protein